MSIEWSAQPATGHHVAWPSLPDDAVLEYLAEGAANIVYRVSVSGERKSLMDPLEGTLLRLHKDLPTTPSTLTTQTAYSNYLEPLFPSHVLLRQTAVSLPPALIPKLNASLGMVGRPVSRLDTKLALESHGLLITDMSPPPSARLIEFKPKWLLQSPTAPENATRCRTCALRQRRHFLKIKTAASSKQPSGPPGYCPLDIVSEDKTRVEKAAWRILFPEMVKPSDTRFKDREKKLWEAFTTFLRTTEIMGLLKAYQLALDGKNALFDSNLSGKEERDLLLAYTLRDCSIFVLVPDKGGEALAKIGDLDLKSKLKIEKWREMERELIDEGWYTGEEKVGCALET